MDSKFLEFWGKSLLNLARGQRRLEELGRLMGVTIEDEGSFAELFRRTCGLEKFEKDGTEYLKLYEQASQSYRQSLRDFFGLFDMVPRSELEALAEKCRSLEAKTAEQEQLIEDLATMGKGAEHDKTVRELQGLIEKQTREFQDMMKTMGQAFKGEKPSKPKKK